MNYYQRHLGDYARDTGHLSLLEHGVYTLLLDRYYATEAGIPAEQAHRLARARTPEECEAVDRVLEEFFVLAEGVWTQPRVERELADACGRIEAARENGKRGGRPRKTQEKPSGFPLGSVLETQPKAHQAPTSIKQELQRASSDAEGVARARSSAGLEPSWADDPARSAGPPERGGPSGRSGPWPGLEADSGAPGMMVLPVPGTGEAGCSVSAMGGAVAEFGQFVGEVTAALADGSVSANELARVEAEGRQALAAIHALLQHVGAVYRAGLPQLDRTGAVRPLRAFKGVGS